MPLKLYNSYSKKLEGFKPLKGKTVTMYNCGPTVYDYVHIGNLRSFLFADLLRRYLEYKGFTVKQVMNITDVGHALGDADAGRDKIEEAAARDKVSPQEVSKKFTDFFFRDIERLNIEPAYKYPRATEHVPDMIELIGKLLKKKKAYQVENDVYYDVSKFPKYGELSGNTLDSLKAGARVEINPKKKNPYDFALWIYNPRHLMQWPSPWGSGYPGWHIECSAMSMKYLGPTIDIHTGGEDNKFPHHEAEIAQSEGATGKKFARYWLHVAFMNVEGQKMSKSLGNFLRLDDLMAKGYEPRVVRYALLAAHYRDNLNFTYEALDAAKQAIGRIDELCERLKARGSGEKPSKEFVQIQKKSEKAFETAMDNDINVPQALAAVFDFVRETNRLLDQGKATDGDKVLALSFIDSAFVRVFGIQPSVQEEIPESVSRLLKERELARKEKDFKRSDELRDRLKEFGFEVKDTPNGQILKKI